MDENYYDNLMDYESKIEQMFPDVYNNLLPYINEEVEQLDGIENLTEEDIDQLTRQILVNSNTINALPSGHNENTINDIARVLLLLAIYNQYQYYPGYYPYPTPLFPFFWFGNIGNRPPGRPGHGLPGRPNVVQPGRPGGNRPGGNRPGGGLGSGPNRPGGGNRPGGNMGGGNRPGGNHGGGGNRPGGVHKI